MDVDDKIRTPPQRKPEPINIPKDKSGSSLSSNQEEEKNASFKKKSRHTQQTYGGETANINPKAEQDRAEQKELEQRLRN